MSRNEWEEDETFKSHVVLKLEERIEKNIRSQFVCNRHPSRK